MNPQKPLFPALHWSGLLLAGTLALLPACGDDSPSRSEPPGPPDADSGPSSDADADVEPAEDIQDGGSALLEPCEQNSDCQSGFCVSYAGGHVCSSLCMNNDVCPEGWSCLGLLQTGGEVFICQPPEDYSCTPCTRNEECGRGQCIRLDEADTRSYCLQPCPDGHCRDGFQCLDLVEEEQSLGMHCRPESESCSCQPANEGMTRFCSVSNEAGTCPGREICQRSTAEGEENEGRLGWSACDAKTPLPETCNRYDDNCNGLLDEDFLDLYGICQRGQGACLRYGTFVCTADGAGTRCNAEEIAPGEEICNGIDDDCDGETDEELSSDPCPLQDGVCRGKVRSCNGPLGWQECNFEIYGADFELEETRCDGKDNDCDGSTDEVDLDGDSHRAAACGGDDCNDRVSTVHPGAREEYDLQDNDCNGLVDEGRIPPGSVIFTELLAHPGAGPAGEWFELSNRWSFSVNLDSWEVEGPDGAGESVFVDAPEGLVLAPGESAVLCAEQPGLGTLDLCSATYPHGTGPDSLGLNDAGSDTLRLVLGGQLIDQVVLDAAPAGQSRSLDPAAYDPELNDNPAQWCVRATPSPGATNPDCFVEPRLHSIEPGDGVDDGGEVITLRGEGFTGVTDVKLDHSCESWRLIDAGTLTCVTPAHPPAEVKVTLVKGPRHWEFDQPRYRFVGENVRNINWCEIHFPIAAVTINAGQPDVRYYGQVRSPRVTEPAGAPQGIIAQIGYGPRGVDPRNQAGWRWQPAAWQEQFSENDQFLGVLDVRVPGEYSVAFRFSDDGGFNYMFCDLLPGTADGFFPRSMGELLVR